MKALLVKEDGLIYAAEVPEERNFHQDFFEEKRYKAALASAKESAVLVSDQEKAHGIIWRNYASKKDRQHGNELKPGIYPIPDLDWEVNGSCPCCEVVTGCQALICHHKKVAILKESTPSTEQESQEELWLEVMGILFAQYLSKGSMDYRETMKQFTITRKP